MLNTTSDQSIDQYCKIHMIPTQYDFNTAKIMHRNNPVPGAEGAIMQAIAQKYSGASAQLV
jgi:hypothetical protein